MNRIRVPGDNHFYIALLGTFVLILSGNSPVCRKQATVRLGEYRFGYSRSVSPFGDMPEGEVTYLNIILRILRTLDPLRRIKTIGFLEYLMLWPCPNE